MNNSELAERLHSIGISDERLAAQCGITRQYMWKVRIGDKTGSEELHDKLQALYDGARRRGLVKEPIIVDSTKPMAITPYDDPSAQYIASIQQPTYTATSIQVQPPMSVQEPVKKKSPFDDVNLLEVIVAPVWLACEIGKDILGLFQKSNKQDIPIPAIETPEIKPVSTRNNVNLRAPEPKVQGKQPAIESSPMNIAYLSDSEYRNLNF